MKRNVIIYIFFGLSIAVSSCDLFQKKHEETEKEKQAIQYLEQQNEAARRNENNNRYSNNANNSNNGYTNQNNQSYSGNQRSYTDEGSQNSNNNSELNVAEQAYRGGLQQIKNKNNQQAEALFSMAIGAFKNANVMSESAISSYYFIALAEVSMGKNNIACPNLDKFRQIYSQRQDLHTDLVEKVNLQVQQLENAACQ